MPDDDIHGSTMIPDYGDAVPVDERAEPDELESDHFGQSADETLESGAPDEG